MASKFELVANVHSQNTKGNTDYFQCPANYTHFSNKIKSTTFETVDELKLEITKMNQ